ncbi:MAG: hypothetical protein RXR08_13365, partial [Sulfolobaceae archaeon]
MVWIIIASYREFGKKIKLASKLTVCPYTFISIILCSFMVECRDLALNHKWVMGLFRAQRHGAHISVIS